MESGQKRRLHRRESGGCDDYELFYSASGVQFLSSRSGVVPSCWVAHLLGPTPPPVSAAAGGSSSGEEETGDGEAAVVSVLPPGYSGDKQTLVASGNSMPLPAEVPVAAVTIGAVGTEAVTMPEVAAPPSDTAVPPANAPVAAPVAEEIPEAATPAATTTAPAGGTDAADKGDAKFKAKAKPEAKAKKSQGALRF